MQAIDRLFRPRSVAVVGASADPTKLTGRPISYLKRHGFSGQIFPINPRYRDIAGMTCYPDVGALPDPPDVGLVLVSADRVAEAVRQLAEAGTGAAIVLASGFGEAGDEGAQRERDLKGAAGTMRLLGPNTIGLANITDRIMLSASGAMELDTFAAGPIALVSQSGGILGSLLSRAAARGIGFSKLVATGNEIDLDVADCIDYLLDDAATSVIALYLEGLRAPERVGAAAVRAARVGKPIVAFKVGRSAPGARAAVSHTGALAGADRVYDAFFQQLGVIRATTFGDLLDIPVALAQQRALRGRRLAIVTSTGGAATLVADSAGVAGFDTPAPDDATAGKLRALDIRDAVLDRNPIDVTLAGLRPDLLRTVIDVLLASPSYDAVIVIVGASGIGQPELVARPVIDALRKTDKPLLVYVSPEAPQIVNHLNRSGVPAFGAPEGCAAALAAVLKATARRSQPSASGSHPRPEADQHVNLPDLPRSDLLNEVESKQLFARFGIKSAQEIVAATPRDAEAAARRIGGEVVLKVLSRHVAHKTELGGVIVGVAPPDVARQCAELDTLMRTRTLHALEGFLVQERISEGVEVILGCHRDPQLGPAILLGMGGIAAELFDDTVLRLPPLDRRGGDDMVAGLEGGGLVCGFRGRAACGLDALAKADVSFCVLWGVIGTPIGGGINTYFC